MTEKVCNVFISHIHEDDADLTAMKELLSKNGCEFRDSSVNSSNPNEAKDPDYIKSQILAPKIQWAGTVVVLVSPDTCKSEWVQWEIEYANKLGKRIVGVWAHGAKDSDLPENLDDYADALVGWQAEKIIDAIYGKSNDWQTPSGQAAQERKIAHYSC